jgi:hypothetical protein
MEEDGRSATPRRQQPAPEPGRQLVAAPKDYFLGPVFAAAKQTGPREVVIGHHRYLIGGFHPMRPDFHPPALDVRHARAIFALLSFRDRAQDTRLIRFSFNEFCRTYAKTNGGRYAGAIKRIVADLLDAYIRVTDLRTNTFHQYRLIERVDIEGRPTRRHDAALAQDNQAEIWFNGATLSPEFAGLLGRIAELQHLNLAVFTSIRSPLAQAVYLYLPSRAHHHTQENPFEIAISKLLQQVSFPVPRHKSLRKKLFCQHQERGRSILQQLDGLETLSGRFRLALAETSDGADWKLLTWVERQRRVPRSGAAKISCSRPASLSARLRQPMAMCRRRVL